MRATFLTVYIILITNLISFSQAKFAYAIFYQGNDAYVSSVVDVTSLDCSGVHKNKSDGYYGEKSKKEFYYDCVINWFTKIVSKTYNGAFRAQEVFFKDPYDTYGCTHGNEESCFTTDKAKMETIRKDGIASAKRINLTVIEF